jgi:hypothetical protein
MDAAVSANAVQAQAESSFAPSRRSFDVKARVKSGPAE